MIASMLAVTNPGDEVIVFEPYYENYGPDTFALRRHSETGVAAPAGLDL